jgi:hypothetical protein
MLEFIAYWQPLPTVFMLLGVYWISIQYPLWMFERSDTLMIQRARRAVWSHRQTGFPVSPASRYIPWWYWVLAPFAAAQARHLYQLHLAIGLAELERDRRRSNYHRLISDHQHLKENQ